MILHFPNARLYIKNLTHEGLTGSAAIVQAAQEFGLIDAETARSITAEAESLDGGKCHCLGAARQVLNKYFAGRDTYSADKRPDVDKVWTAIVREAEAYKKESRAATEDHNGQTCNNTAVLFDLLLQQIRRYP